MQRRLHLLAIPHTVTNHDYVACAYTQKNLKFARMMTELGHEVIHYGHERSAVVCSEHVTVTDDAVLTKAYGDHDWRRHQFRHNVQDFAHQEFSRRAIPEVRARAQPNDFLLCTWGYGHQPIADAVTDTGVIACEPGVGYTSGHFARWRAYESHAVRNSVEGQQNPQNWYSWVIPNYFDPADFTYSTDKDDYVLFLGRVTEIKGISTCIRATEAAGVRLKIAGQGRIADCGWTTTPDHVEELGYADREMRRELMARARALIIATTYNEPFGGVVVEALLSGTPIITPHFGAFAEIQTPHTGFQCHTLRDYVTAIKNIDHIDPRACRARGLDYTLEQVGPQFERWFDAISEIYTADGWMTL
jgi:glycosyltransferase involved in cell wall biosynthesis